MDRLIKVYDNVIDIQTCDNIVSKFEQFENQHESFDDRGMIFTQLNMAKSPQIWSAEIEKFTEIFQNAFTKYLTDTKVTPQQIPNNYMWEPIRIKRYLPNNYDEFRPHVDVNQKANCTRFLVMFLYLADNKKGKTIFPNLDIEIECKQGSLLMFPPMWPWLHAGQKPARTSKYIVQSYLHYV
jgi:hypothetical protein